MTSRSQSVRLSGGSAVLLVAALVAGAVLRAWLAFHDDGIYWCDEVHQTVEPAHRLVWGYGLTSWEYTAGARHATLAYAIALLMRGARLVGLGEPRGYLSVVRLAFCAVSLASAVGAYALARAHRAAPLPAAAGAALWALCGPAVYFAPRAMSESASGLAVVWGLALALDRDAGGVRTVAGASLLGIAVMLRLHNGIVCAALLVVLAVRRPRKTLVAAAATLALWAAIFGLVDRLTWGTWFHSARAYLEFTLVSGDVSSWGHQPLSYFARVVWTSMPGVALAIASGFVFGWKRAGGLVFVSIAFLALHTSYPHKELRFLLPILPALCGLAGVAAGVVGERIRPTLAPAALVAAAALSAVTFRQLTFADLGQYEGVKPTQSAYDDYGPVNRLLVVAGRRPGICGIKVEVARLAWTGGYAYFHRRVPLYDRLGPARASGFFNYAISSRTEAGGAPVVASSGDLVLVQSSSAPCRADPDFAWPRFPWEADR